MNEQQRSEHIRLATDLFSQSLTYIFPTRDSGLQKEAIQHLETLLVHNAVVKVAAVNDGNEDFANLCLGIEAVAAALRAEISMWLLLKQDRPEAAWEELVTAQNGICRRDQGTQGIRTSRRSC
jgi:hypothetical protein